jgi:hypothetical protein
VNIKEEGVGGRAGMQRAEKKKEREKKEENSET